MTPTLQLSLTLILTLNFAQFIKSKQTDKIAPVSDSNADDDSVSSFDSQPFHDDSFRSDSFFSPLSTASPGVKKSKSKKIKNTQKNHAVDESVHGSDDDSDEAERRLQAALDAVQVLTRKTPAPPPVQQRSTPKPTKSIAVNEPFYKGIQRPTDCRAMDDVEAATACIRRARASIAFSCADVDQLAIDAHPFAYGRRKIVFRARWHGVSVIVKRPRKSPIVTEKFTPFDDWRLFRDESFLFATLVADSSSFDADSLLDTGGRMRIAPHFHGMCLEPGRLMTIFEPADTLDHYRRSHTLSLTDAVAVAAGVVNIARYLAHDTPLGPLVHCDIHHRQVAFVPGSGDGRPLAVIMDLDELRSAPLAANSTCAKEGDSIFQCDKACFKAFHYSDFATANVRLAERVCATDSQHCLGFDTSFNSFTFVGYLLWELFLRPTSSKQDLEFVTMMAELVDRARNVDPAKRGDVEAVSKRIAQFAKERKLSIGFRPLTSETLRPYRSIAADDAKPTNVHHVVSGDGTKADAARGDIDRDPKQNAPLTPELVASMIHLLHPIQVAAAQRGAPLRERMKAVEDAARDDSRFIDAEAQKSFIVARLGEHALPTPAPVRKTKPAGTTPAPRALSPQEQREAAQRAQMARIDAAREARDKMVAHQLSTGLRLPQPKQVPNQFRQR
jgi:hypothetical protein